MDNSARHCKKNPASNGTGRGKKGGDTALGGRFNSEDVYEFARTQWLSAGEIEHCRDAGWVPVCAPAFVLTNAGFEVAVERVTARKTE